MLDLQKVQQQLDEEAAEEADRRHEMNIQCHEANKRQVRHIQLTNSLASKGAIL